MLKLRNETKVGILAIVATALAVWGFQFLKGINLLSRSQIFYVRYTNVDELRPSSYVFINGFQVGTVKDMYIDPEDDKTIIAVLSLKGNIDIPKDTRAVIVGLGVMGGRAINLEFSHPCEGDDCAEDGDYLQGESQSFVQSVLGDPAQLDPYLQKLQLGLTAIYDSIADPRDPQGLGKTLVALHESLVNIAAMTGKISRLMDASTAGISATANNAAEITGNLKQSNAAITKALNDLAILTEQLKSANLDQTAKSAGVALDSVTTSMAALRNTLLETQGTIMKIDSLAQNMVDGKGTVGKVLNDEELYVNLVRTSRQLELFMQDLRLNPRRYNTVKVKVFGKNKARDYVNPIDDPAYQMVIDSLEEDYSRRVKNNN